MKNNLINAAISAGELTMQGLNTVKKDFHLPLDLFERVEETAKDAGKSFSEFCRQALLNLVEQKEAEKFERELREGYKANAAYYQKQANEWESAQFD